MAVGAAARANGADNGGAEKAARASASGWRADSDASADGPPPSPEETAGLFSKLTYRWIQRARGRAGGRARARACAGPAPPAVPGVNPLISIGVRVPLEEGHLFPLARSERAERAAPLLKREWEAELRASRPGGPSLLRALNRAYGLEFHLLCTLRLVYEFLTFITPVVLHALISSLEDPAGDPGRPFGLAVALFFCAAASAFLFHFFFQALYRLVMRVRCGLVAAVYAKMVRVSSPCLAHHNMSVGTCVSLATTDVAKIQDVILFIYYLWTGPYSRPWLWCCSGCTLAGPPSQGSPVSFWRAILLTGSVARRLEAVRRQAAAATDARLRFLSEARTKLQAYPP
eukprot:tig00020592_g11634.t1